MGYPNRVTMEFCHKQKVWRSYDGAKIVAFNDDDKILEAITPNHYKLLKSETKVPGHVKGTYIDNCSLHGGAF